MLLLTFPLPRRVLQTAHPDKGGSEEAYFRVRDMCASRGTYLLAACRSFTTFAGTNRRVMNRPKRPTMWSWKQRRAQTCGHRGTGGAAGARAPRAQMLPHSGVVHYRGVPAVRPVAAGNVAKQSIFSYFMQVSGNK